MCGSLPHGSADRNIAAMNLASYLDGSLPHGSADRNNAELEQERQDCRRSLTGARIETHTARHANLRAGVAPSRERGSKRSPLRWWTPTWRSLPHGSADRNGGMSPEQAFGRRRSLTGARIETRAPAPSALPQTVAPSRERGSKHRLGRAPPGRRIRSLPHGSADRNKLTEPAMASGRLSLPHGSADRNSSTSTATLSCCSRSLTGARIETGLHRPGVCAMSSRSLTGARIETDKVKAPPHFHSVAPSRERGSKQ